jgi:hypothetical protein
MIPERTDIENAQGCEADCATLDDFLCGRFQRIGTTK